MGVTVFLYLKFQYSNIALGGAKMQAGKRAAEDTFQNSEPKQEDIE